MRGSGEGKAPWQTRAVLGGDSIETKPMRRREEENQCGEEATPITRSHVDTEELEAHMRKQMCEMTQRYLSILSRPRAKEIMFVPVSGWPQWPMREEAANWEFDIGVAAEHRVHHDLAQEMPERAQQQDIEEFLEYMEPKRGAEYELWTKTHI